MQITIRPKRLAAILALIILGLAIADIGVKYAWFGLGHNYMMGLVPMFHVDYEANVPTWFSSINLLLSAVLLALIARASRAEQDGRVRHWTVLAWVFLYLSIDELAQIHDQLGNYLGSWLLSYIETTGPLEDYLRYPWVVLGAAAVLVVGLSFLPFLFRLPLRTRLLCILSATIFVGGALGIEMIAVRHVATGGGQVTYAVYTFIEEIMEMAGIALFNYTLADYLCRSQKGTTWRLEFVDGPKDQETNISVEERSQVSAAS